MNTIIIIIMIFIIFDYFFLLTLLLGLFYALTHQSLIQIQTQINWTDFFFFFTYAEKSDCKTFCTCAFIL